LVGHKETTATEFADENVRQLFSESGLTMVSLADFLDDIDGKFFFQVARILKIADDEDNIWLHLVWSRNPAEQIKLTCQSGLVAVRNCLTRVYRQGRGLTNGADVFLKFSGQLEKSEISWSIGVVQDLRFDHDQSDFFCRARPKIRSRSRQPKTKSNTVAAISA